MSKNKKSSVSRIVSFALIALTAILLFVILLSKASGKPVFIFNRSMMWVLTPSMETEIPEKSYILVESVNADAVEVNDVISFYSDDPSIAGQLNTHRVIGIDQDGYFITKGDNNIAADTYSVNPDNVIARYIRVLPIMTAIGRFLLWGPGILVVIALLGVLIAVIYIPEIIKTARQVSAQKEQDAKQAEIQKLVQQEVERLKQEQDKK